MIFDSSKNIQYSDAFSSFCSHNFLWTAYQRHAWKLLQIKCFQEMLQIKHLGQGPADRPQDPMLSALLTLHSKAAQCVLWEDKNLFQCVNIHLQKSIVIPLGHQPSIYSLFVKAKWMHQ